MKILFVVPELESPYQGLSVELVPMIKKVISQSRTLAKRLDVSQRSLSGLGLLTAAASARNAFKEIRVEYFDENMEPSHCDDILDQGYDMIATGGHIFQMNRMTAIVRDARKKKIPVIVGGPLVMTFPDFFQRDGVTVIHGECERIFPEFLTDYIRNNNRLPLKRFYDSASYIEMEESPVPLFELAEKYDYSFVGIQATRGCPFHCEFCQITDMLGRKYRQKSMDRIIEEIKRVKALWPEAFFFFYDNDLFSDREFARNLFKRIHSEGIYLGKWGTNAGASVYKETELLDLALKIGDLAYLGIGFESVSDDSLKTIHNKQKAALRIHYEEIIRSLKEKNIGVYGYFMFGFENSRPEDLSSIIAFIKKNEINAQVSRLIPMPGTKFFNRLVREYEQDYGPIKKSGIGKWNIIRKYLVDKSGIPEVELNTLLIHAYADIYDDQFHKEKVLLPAPQLC